jgi:hypothetical protein
MSKAKLITVVAIVAIIGIVFRRRRSGSEDSEE